MLWSIIYTVDLMKTFMICIRLRCYLQVVLKSELLYCHKMFIDKLFNLNYNSTDSRAHIVANLYALC